MRRSLALVGIALVLAGVRAQANGTIDVSDSTVAAGAAPQQGAVTLDPCAPPGPAPAQPSIGAVGTPAAMTGGVPAFPGGGSGGDGVFHATSSAALFGGNYEFSSYTVDAGVVLRYSSPVVIRTTGDVVLDGQIIIDQGDVTFECAGDLSVRANQGIGAVGIATFGGSVRFDVAGRLRIIDISPAPSEATSAFTTTDGTGDMEFVARGGPSTAPLEIRNTHVGAHHIDVRSAGGIVVYGGGGLNTFHDGNITLRAFGGDVDVQRTNLYSYGAVDVEASGAVRGDLAFLRTWFHHDVKLTAFGGPLVLSQGSVYAVEGGDVRLRAAGNAELRDGVQVEVLAEDGTMEMTAFGGDLKLVGGGNRFVNSGVGPASLSASGAMTIDTSATVGTTQGDLALRAYGGALTCSGAVAVDAAVGALDVGASGDVTAAAGGDLRFSGDSVRVVGGRVDLAAALVARTGAIALSARDALAGKGVWEAATQFTATSITGGVTFDDCTITTDSDVGDRSGDVRIESYGGATGARIAARRAVIASGDHATASGDVILRVVTVPRPTVTTYLLPNTVTLKLGAKKPSLRADGTIACPSAWLTAGAPAALPFVFDVGTKQISGDLALRPNGSDREFKAPGALLRVSPSKTGASRGVFSVRLDEDLTGLVPLDGLVDFRLSLDGTEFLGTVRLTAGKFKLGTTRGAVAELLYPLAVTVQSKGAGKDALAMTLGFASDGATPEAPSDLALDFGDGFSVKVAAEDFVVSGGRFVAKNPPSAPGLTLVSLDYEKETVTVKGKALDLGAFSAQSPVSLRIGVGLGGDLRSVDVALSRKGTKLTY